MWRLSVLLGGAAMSWAVPLHAQDDVAPTPIAKATTAPKAVPHPADTNVGPFYSAHPGSLLWLRNSDGRTAASQLANFLKNAPIDGMDEGPALAASVEAALANGTPADDQIISTAFVRYVDVLDRPVNGVSFGDPTLQLEQLPASAILSRALEAASLSAYVQSVAQVNPLYSQLRSDAAAAGEGADPHVRATLNRLRLVPSTGRAILVDAANAQLMELEDGKIIETMKVIVGKPDFPTPLLAGKIWYVTFNPYWHIPPDVAKRKVAPIVLKRGVSYLKAARYQTVEAFGSDQEEPIDPTSIDWKAVAAGKVDVHIRQLSGPNNMMGAMKFGFNNDFGIFLHDTPHKNLFAKTKRNLSLGCVRVEHPQQLAQWLLGHEPDTPSDDLEENVRIGAGVPIYISYLTARPTGETISFADDVYKLDGASASFASGSKLSAFKSK